MEERVRKQLRELLQQEVVLATGCTEPGAVALCVTKARELLGREPEHIELKLSKNVFKNAMGVGIPGTGMIGLPIAVAVAVVAGESHRQLEVLTVPQKCVDEANYDYATTAPIEELDFIRETVKYNDAAATEGLKGYGLQTGKILMENAAGDIVHTVIARTVAASDARMDGCTLPVYSNSGSGNQGIACTLPVYNYGKAKGCDEEKITRALVLNHLMSIYIKQGIGRLSALCGIVNASIGVTCGIVYLHGGSFDQMCYAIKNTINTIAGMVCDGAKPSCALKMSTGLYSAFVSAELAYHDRVVDATDGISESDVDCSIHNLGRLGHEGMDQVDDTVLYIMTHKQ